ncbi:MAG: hypothetical protein LBH29_04935 [Elusimicrobiota bacterium]|jgi:hypothetical protein|nr:hypothetical protein [Elusimicrobiota bacterium]
MDCFKLSQIKNLNGKKFRFFEVIEQVENHKVIKFDGDSKLLSVLRTAAKSIIEPVNNSKDKDSNFPKRANEFGNYVERFFRERLQNFGYDCVKPKTIGGKTKEAGYPDCLLIFESKPYYLEVKTCEAGSLNSSFRSFFYSPSESSKIDRDAVHLLIGFKTIKNQMQLTGDILIADLFNKEVTLKLEYNSNNKELYKTSDLL